MIVHDDLKSNEENNKEVVEDISSRQGGKEPNKEVRANMFQPNMISFYVYLIFKLSLPPRVIDK